MEKDKPDIKQLMAVLARVPVKTEFPFAVEKHDIEVQFIGSDGSMCTRPLCVYLPGNAEKPAPLVFNAHYEIAEGSGELGMYLEKGWALSTPIEFKNEYNAVLTADDLAFNSAALSAVRKLPEIDRTRIAVIGGSAGGYMCLMLSALHLGICCTVSFCGITNMLFNMGYYFPGAHDHNLKALAELTDEERADPMRRMETMPVPILGSIYDFFAPIRDYFPDAGDYSRWATFSPVCLAKSFSNPVLFTHFTSDVLVPIDQLTKSFTPPEPGDTLPEGFKLRLSDYELPGELQYSMAEALPAGEVAERLYLPPEEKVDNMIGYDISKRFNIAVYDEGRVEALASHVKNFTYGRNNPTAYIGAQFAATSRLTNILTPQKLALLAERYTGKSVQLPSLKGSHEVMDELIEYTKGRDIYSYHLKIV